MNRLPSLLVRPLLLIFGLLGTGQAFSQTDCNCPALSPCSPCSGGITGVTLKCNRIIGGFVTVKDGTTTLMDNVYVLPGGTFGILAPSGTFESPNISVYLEILFNPVPNATVPVNCAIDIGSNEGDFTIVAATAANGNPVCCKPGSDKTKPVISGYSDINASTPAGVSSCGMSVSWNEPTVTDCNLVSVTSVPANGSFFPVGATTVTYTAKDINNNTTTASFKVNVKDVTPPFITGNSCPKDIVVAADPRTCKATVSWTKPAFNDNCGVTSVSPDRLPGEYGLGTFTVKYTAKDAAGNAVTCSFKVTVNDVTPPDVTDCPETITLSADASCKAKANWKPPVFSDCNGVSLSSSNKPGDQFEVGRNTVTYTATDKAGNIKKCEFLVIVNEVTAPEIKGCPRDTTIVINTGFNIGTVVSWNIPVATDNCSGVELSASRKPGDVLPVGTTTVTYTAKDVSGNTTSCSFVVTVKYDEPELKIFEVLTPDGNGVNDIWFIGNIELFEQNKVTIVDRWGSVIYSASNYDNEKVAWNGDSNSGAPVPTGTYFFTITVNSGKTSMQKKGFIELLR